MKAGTALLCLCILGCAALVEPAGAQPTPQSVLQAKTKGGCITIQEAFVGFGEESARKDAFRRLDKAIEILRERRPRYAEAREKTRSAECSVYIKALNEFECTATATLCR